MKLPRFVSTLVASVVLSTAVFAADFAPAIIYDMGGKFDKSFNQSASDGTVRFKKETGIEVREFEVTNAAQREQAMTRFAQRGSQVIVAIGFSQASAVEAAAKKFPNVKFAIIDGTVNLPNVQSINFRENESSFLCGMAAALEQQFSSIAGIESMSSTSSLGGTSITMQFSLDRNIDGAALDVQSAISAALRSLPSCQ